MLSEAKKLAILGAVVLLIYTQCRGRENDAKAPEAAERAEACCAAAQTISPRENEPATLIHEPAAAAEEWEESFFIPSQAETAVAMTIGNTVMLKNETGYAVDADAIAQGGTSIRLAADGPQILIIHTVLVYIRQTHDDPSCILFQIFCSDLFPVDSLVAEEEFAVPLSDLPDHSAGIACGNYIGRDIAVDHASGTND